MRYTNHSLRATAITRMFNNGVEEKIIAETSGHKSIKALRVYERTSEQQMKQVTRVINQSEVVEQPECNLGKNSGEDKPDVRMNDGCTAQSGSAIHSSIGTHPNFSGTFSHCTINLTLK